MSNKVLQFPYVMGPPSEILPWWRRIVNVNSDFRVYQQHREKLTSALRSRRPSRPSFVFLLPPLLAQFVSFVPPCMYWSLCRSVFVSGISEFLFITEEEHLQQFESKLGFYKMVFITGKLFSASTLHANKNFI